MYTEYMNNGMIPAISNIFRIVSSNGLGLVCGFLVGSLARNADGLFGVSAQEADAFGMFLGLLTLLLVTKIADSTIRKSLLKNHSVS